MEIRPADRFSALLTDWLPRHPILLSSSFDFNQHRPIIHKIPLVNLNAFNGPGHRRLHRNLHLHRFQHNHILVNRDLVPWLHQKFQDDARHIRYNTFHKECGVETRLPSGDGRKHRSPSKLITVAVHTINRMTVTMADALDRPCSCRDIEEASSADCYPSDVRSDFLALSHHCLDDIASLVALH